MTNYGKWDAKATELVREADEDDERAKAENDAALGLTDGPKGPPTANAEAEMKDFDGHSSKRKEFIDWSNKREVQLTHCKEETPIELTGEGSKGKAVRLSGCEDVRYVVPADSGIVKLMIDKSKRVRIEVQGSLITSTIEAYSCEDLRIDLVNPLGTLQVDECTGSVIVHFAELEHVGRIYHQNSPGLAISWAGGNEDLHTIGIERDAQFCTGRNSSVHGRSGEQLVTRAVVRGEGEFPVDMGGPLKSGPDCPEEPDAETPPAAEERKRRAEEKRVAGNEMFRANDFMQAAMQYTEALNLDPEASAVWANRAQCWLKLGDHDKALSDAAKCIEVDDKNAKGWFRKGMSLHAMKRYSEAIPALLEAEKLEPGNKQIPEAIKMSQLMARKHASGA